jgi:hypothetical protein
VDERWRDKRSATPKPRAGSTSPLEEFATEVFALNAEQPDLTLEEILAELRKRRIRTSCSSLWRFSIDTQAAERERADVARACRRWIREQGLLDPARLVYIDETAVSTNLTRLPRLDTPRPCPARTRSAACCACRRGCSPISPTGRCDPRNRPRSRPREPACHYAGGVVPTPS